MNKNQERYKDKNRNTQKYKMSHSKACPNTGTVFVHTYVIY